MAPSHVVEGPAAVKNVENDGYLHQVVLVVALMSFYSLYIRHLVVFLIIQTISLHSLSSFDVLVNLPC